MILSEIVAIRNKIIATGGDIVNDLSLVLSDNRGYGYTNSNILNWDDTKEILTIKKEGKSNFRNPATGRMEVRYSVDFISYAKIQLIRYMVSELDMSAMNNVWNDSLVWNDLLIWVD